MKKKNLFRIRNTKQALIFSILTGTAVTAAIICLLAAILVKFDVPSQNVKYLLFAPAVIGGLITGIIAGKYVKSRGFLWGCVSSAAVSLILIIILLLINSFTVDPVMLLIVPAYALFGTLGGIIASNLK